MDIEKYPAVSSDIILAGDAMLNRTALLGNQSGLVLHLPVELNVRDRTLVPSKWFGAAAFGRHYLTATRLWVVLSGELQPLDRKNQTEFTQAFDRVVRTYRIHGLTVRQTFFVPDGVDAIVMSVECDHEVRVVAEPQFDMRYYQSFNTDFAGYSTQIEPNSDGERLIVSNRTAGPTLMLPELTFHAVIAAANGTMRVELLPLGDRLREKTFLVDERRQKAIHTAYAETHVESPDHAPIWEQYSTMVYAPATIHGTTPLHLVHAFAPGAEQACSAADETIHNFASLRESKRAVVAARLAAGKLATGKPEIDTAYAQVLARFNDCLVARGITVRAHGDEEHSYDAIFAGDKYFLDAWKRDENISLGALLATGDYATMRSILKDTWQFQDERTGRLPQIIRLGDPVVYYSSDGTLWALRRLAQYTRTTGDTSLLDAKYSMVEHFFSASLGFVQRGLLPSGGIVDKGYLWETWEDTPYTPRDGYPVEIELLWLCALESFLPAIRQRNPMLAERLQAAHDEGRDTFNLFYLDGYLADSLSYQWKPRKLLTPNGYIAFEVDYPLPADFARSMVMLGREQLAGRVGIRGLAPRDWPSVLTPEFVADTNNVKGDDMASVGIYNYHRGIEWLWLNQFFVRGELCYGDPEKAYERYVEGQVQSALHAGGVGGLSELYDMHGPLGADFQAWSMSSFIESLHAFGGIDVDAVSRKVSVRPLPPKSWESFRARRKVGETQFDVEYRREGSAQVVGVRAIDPIPDGYSLRVGVRLDDGPRAAGVTVNGEAAAGQVEHRGEHGCESWVETPFTPNVEARFGSRA